MPNITQDSTSTNKEIATLRRETYQAIRQNASLAHAIEALAENAIDQGEMTERQIETIAALAQKIHSQLDQLSIIISEK